MRDLPESVFTVDEALARGWTSSALKHAVRCGRIVRVRRGVYATTGRPPAADVAAIAAARAIPRAVVSHRSAALLHGLPVLGPRPVVAEITVPPRTSGNHPGVHLFRAAVRPEDVVLIRGVPVTSAARTVADLGRHRPRGAAVSVTDAVLHRELSTVEEIQDVLRFCATWPRVRRARRALDQADGRAESPLESISRLVLPALGMPRPEIQKRIFDRHGLLIGRSDFYWDEYGVVGEADGRIKYTDRDVLTNEKERQEQLEDLGLVVVRWGWDHATTRRHVLKARIENAIARGCARDRSGFPRLWTR